MPNNNNNNNNNINNNNINNNNINNNNNKFVVIIVVAIDALSTSTNSYSKELVMRTRYTLFINLLQSKRVSIKDGAQQR